MYTSRMVNPSVTRRPQFSPNSPGKESPITVALPTICRGLSLPIKSDQRVSKGIGSEVGREWQGIRRVFIEIVFSSLTGWFTGSMSSMGFGGSDVSAVSKGFDSSSYREG